MAIHSRTVLVALTQERDRIKEALKMDPAELKANLAATERLIAIYQARATESSLTRLPANLKAATKIRSENGNGKIRNAQGRLVNPHSENQQKFVRMRAILSDPNNGKKTGMAAYINSGYLTKHKNGTYTVTPKGKQRLAELTDAPTP